ncbi:hypothetical protein A2276_00690 [candidate division WOR-1 bacterium RIFOXYA12_FULL_43_27]|uniref:Membrane insertase YidC/Oxa/ALB C-terminal domain-containing protein n=1 Tax=candidate division WOR-1 bacterium RIFOXYC2_FULL_46_14 TaxID=1802587 RepID=A0A1F4U4L1_UNCSA|nr:MAG: hypothetical protein A2276_00690 [candidate division WOR-1 bacterium RIFOXYA12_FULL_43_27]OGC20792.1 MAG: hypothetical protein A2292_07185 [candidate division WOR-1 bacterium RIFOXYB2_FULL_46_45]OGC31471.1 MAG: hypothetical protein A2232_04265 [candidate division WOR-1 bacterium RIFOXYA2_FULL_46_56]OGC39876.1 MAG: hypothetical protein A2438_05100 [candidate division WOR-1 bacterium RIFOXYC2_FULL_46_14]
MEIITNLMLQGLQFFYSISGNYGLAIMLFTIAVNVVLYPLTLQSTVQMAAFQRIQPLMQEIQKKFKDEPQKLQKEMMELYKKEKVNPFGGCLPTLLKLPFFIGLFMVLQGKEFVAIIADPKVNASFLWIANLAKPDHLFIFPILIGLSTYWMQKTMPTSNVANSQMQMMTYFMPIFLTFICLSFPTGVQIYWLVSNLMAVVQQLWIVHKVMPKRA